MCHVYWFSATFDGETARSENHQQKKTRVEIRKFASRRNYKNPKHPTDRERSEPGRDNYYANHHRPTEPSSSRARERVSEWEWRVEFEFRGWIARTATAINGLWGKSIVEFAFNRIWNCTMACSGNNGCTNAATIQCGRNNRAFEMVIFFFLSACASLVVGVELLHYVWVGSRLKIKIIAFSDSLLWFEFFHRGSLKWDTFPPQLLHSLKWTVFVHLVRFQLFF